MSDKPEIYIDPDEERDLQIFLENYPPDEPYPEYCQGFERHHPIKDRRG